MGVKKIKVSHYREKCIGCGACVLMAPQNWKMNAVDGKSDLLGAQKGKRCYEGNIHQEDLEDNLLAEQNCPVNIIQIHK